MRVPETHAFHIRYIQLAILSLSQILKNLRVSYVISLLQNRQLGKIKLVFIETYT